MDSGSKVLVGDDMVGVSLLTGSAAGAVDVGTIAGLSVGR
jgi:hypothetical protein